MLWAIIVILLLLWAVGAFAFTLGPLVHLLLVVVVIVLVVQLLTQNGRRPLV